MVYVELGRQMVDESWLSSRVGKRDSEWADSILRVALLNCLENVAFHEMWRTLPFNLVTSFSGGSLGCHCFVALS